MSRLIHIRTYSPGTAQIVKQTLIEVFDGLWLARHTEKVFHICDELIKNGIKSNYRTILYWTEARRLIQQASPETSTREADQWLYEVFYSGEDALVDRQFRRVDRSRILQNLLSIFEMESAYVDHRSGRRRLEDTRSLAELVKLKRFCRRHRIGVELRIETAGDRINITVMNDAPILEEDLARIVNIRSTFRQYQREGHEENYFLDHIDTSGGGHGLGYPLMDALLTAMKLDPDTSLYLISATRTLVLLTLPTAEPRPAAQGPSI